MVKCSSRIARVKSGRKAQYCYWQCHIFAVTSLFMFDKLHAQPTLPHSLLRYGQTEAEKHFYGAQENSIFTFFASHVIILYSCVYVIYKRNFLDLYILTIFIAYAMIWNYLSVTRSFYFWLFEIYSKPIFWKMLSYNYYILYFEK